MSPDPAALLKRRLAALPARLRGEAAAALADVGTLAVTEARRLLGEAGGDGQPSRPGAPPRDVAGTLAATLRATPDPVGAGVTVGTPDPRAAFLEYGTRRMAARPFLRPAATAVQPEARRLCAAALRRAAASLKEPKA